MKALIWSTLFYPLPQGKCEGLDLEELVPAPVVFCENFVPAVEGRQVLHGKPRVLGDLPPAAGLERRGLVHPRQYVELNPLPRLFRVFSGQPETRLAS